MFRSPFRVFVLPFRKTDFRVFEYAFFKKDYEEKWRYISGEGEINDLALKVARREAFKEAYIPIIAEYYLLKTIFAMPAYSDDHDHYAKRDSYVMPGYYFAVDCSDIELKLSRKNTTYKWFKYDAIIKFLHELNDKTALWELNERLLHEDLPPSI
jgi:dATP pyrophosphohydrolase